MDVELVDPPTEVKEVSCALFGRCVCFVSFVCCAENTGPVKEHVSLSLCMSCFFSLSPFPPLSLPLIFIAHQEGGGGGFFLTCKDLGGMFDHSFLHVFVVVCFEVEISSHTLIPLFRPGSVHHSSAS